MPLAGRGRRIANPFHRGPLAFLEFPQDEIVLQGICAHGEIVAVRLEVEQDPGALIDAAGNAFEAHGDLAIAEVRNVLGNDIGEIRIGLNPVEEFGIAVAVERARLVRDAGRGLSLFPLPPIDDQHFVVAVVLDAPDADDADERFRLGADGLVRKVDFQGLCGPRVCQQCRQPDAGGGDGDGALARCHG